MIWLLIYLLGVVASTAIVIVETVLSKNKYDKTRLYACLFSWGTVAIIYYFFILAIITELKNKEEV